MATRTAIITKLSTYGDQAMVVAWSGLTYTTTDLGSAFENPGWADRSIQVTGTFGTGGSVRIQGSNDGTNWAVLTDPQGNDLNITTAKIEQVSEITRYIRPLITAGDGTTSLVVTMLVRRGF